MALNIHLLDTIHEDQYNVNSDSESEDLKDKMNFISENITQELFKLKCKISHINSILDINYNENFVNKDFGKYESIEEHFDKLIFQYSKFKRLLTNGREIINYKESNHIKKENELRYARNELAYYGIKHILNK
jgi:hypothetical protein